MAWSETEIEGCLFDKLAVHNDNRGFLTELFNSDNGLEDFEPHQINWTHSKKNVIRGLHIAPYPKLITCVKGKIIDVCVDMRRNSVTYLQHVAKLLTGTNYNQLYVPANCAHGFMAIEEAIVVYCQGGHYDPDNEWSIHYKDPTINIRWPAAKQYILSAKDLNAKMLFDE